MIYEVQVRAEVEDEVVDISKWYEEWKEGEGLNFIQDFEKSVEFIRQRPFQNMVSEFGPRKMRMLHYPYRIYFSVVKNMITIRAVVHVRRNPDWIKTRFG